jgi:hypothetical protein
VDVEQKMEIPPTSPREGEEYQAKNIRGNYKGKTMIKRGRR